MIYLIRIWNLISIVLLFIFKILAYISIGTLLVLHVVFVVAISPFILVLQLVEYLTIVPIYYIIKGQKYYINYYSIIDIWAFIIMCGELCIKRTKNPYSNYNFDEMDFYERMFGKIKKIKLELK